MDEKINAMADNDLEKVTGGDGVLKRNRLEHPPCPYCSGTLCSCNTGCDGQGHDFYTHDVTGLYWTYCNGCGGVFKTDKPREVPQHICATGHGPR